MGTINYAEKWQQQLLNTIIESSYAAPFIVTNVDWMGAKTFHFSSMSTSGYQSHKLSGGWNRGDYNTADHPFTVSIDRDVEFFIDKRDIDESNQTLSIQNISEQFTRTKAVPEMDATFFSKVASVAEENKLVSSTALSAYTKANVLEKLKTIMGKVRLYRNKGLVLYIKPEIMDLLSLSPDLQKTINTESIVQNGKAIQTRITTLDGVPLVEVIDDTRFYTGFDYTDGFTPKAGAYAINVLAATPLSTHFVSKINSIYFFAPGEHQQGDGYLYQNRALWDTFVLPNGASGAVDSVYVDRDTTAVTA